MSTARSDASSASRRLILLGLAGVFVAFAAYGSFVPLRWNAVPLDAAVERFAQTPFIPLSRASRSDFLTNVLLFVPIGFFRGAANRSRGLAVVWLLPVTLVCLGLSVAIEFGQIGFGLRDVVECVFAGWVATGSRGPRHSRTTGLHGLASVSRPGSRFLSSARLAAAAVASLLLSLDCCRTVAIGPLSHAVCTR